MQSNSQISGFTIVNDNKTLSKLAKAGLIIWPISVNNSKGIKFKYVDEVESVGMKFEHAGNKYQLRYHSGCFFPYVYQIFGK